MKKFATGIVSAMLFLWLLPCSALAATRLIPVGQVVGLELCDHTVTISSFDEELGSAAKQAGLQVGDRITQVTYAAV